MGGGAKDSTMNFRLRHYDKGKMAARNSVSVSSKPAFRPSGWMPSMRFSEVKGEPKRR
jgi:hypothetical protein